MLVIETRANRRIVGRLDRGVELLEALADICRKHEVRCGEVRALGSLESIEVSEYDQRAKQWHPARRFHSAFEILNVTGNVSERAGELVVHAHITVMRDRDSGIEVLGGHLVRGQVFACEFVIDAFDDVLLRRGHDDPTGLSQWMESSGRATGAEVVAPSPKVTAPQAEAEPVVEVEETDASILQTGDLIDHPRFGRCTVERIEGDHEFAVVRIAAGRVVRLALDVLRFRVRPLEGGRRLFEVRVER